MPDRSRLIYSSKRRLFTLLGAVVLILAAVNVADKVGPRHTGLVVGPTVALLLVLLARKVGLSWHDLGLSRRTFVPGLRYAIGAILAVAVVYGTLQVLHLVFGLFFALLIVCAIRGLSLHVLARRSGFPTLECSHQKSVVARSR